MCVDVRHLHFIFYKNLLFPAFTHISHEIIDKQIFKCYYSDISSLGEGKMDKNEKDWEQMLIKIIKDLPNIDSRIKQVEKINGSIVVETEAGKVILHINDTEKTS